MIRGRGTVLFLALTDALLGGHGASTGLAADPEDRQVTQGPGGRVLTNMGVWSPDGHWIIYDTRSGASGDVFDGRHIEMVQADTGEIRTVFTAPGDANCGVATFSPREPKAVLILGPEHPTPDWSYNAYHRQGIIVPVDFSPRYPGSPAPAAPVQTINLDARDLTPPFTAGALRGGSHVHVWDAAGDWVSFTYEDHVLATLKDAAPEDDLNQRNIGISVPGHAVQVSRDHPRNHDGSCFSALVTRTTAHPRPGSDDINRAYEEGWVGTNGYLKPDGSRQRRALAFQGQTVARDGSLVAEVFMVDVPEDPTVPGAGPLAGTERKLPCPPRGCVQRRLTYTADRKYPGIQGPRHWLRCSSDGKRIAFLMKDERGVAQLWTVSPNGGPPAQLTRNPWPVSSTFTWHPQGKFIAHVLDQSVCVTDTDTGLTRRLTLRSDEQSAPRPEACVFSPDGRRIAYVRRMPHGSGLYNQIFVVTVPQ
jgi:hypothetical protein